MTKLKWIIALILLCSIASSFFYLKNVKQPPQRQTKPLTVDVISTDTNIFQHKITAFGNIQAIKSASLKSHVLEEIEELNFINGGFVEKDSIIAVLKNDQEQALLDAEKFQLKEHERELKRLKTLLKRNVAAQKVYDERQTQKKISLARIQSLKANLANHIIKAPFSGYVSMNKLSIGSVIESGDLIATIKDISTVRLDFKVPSRYLSQLKTGLKVTAITDALPQKRFIGHLEAIEQHIDESSHSILVRAIFNNPDLLLKPGLLMQIEIDFNETNNITVPEEAIFQKSEQHFVWVVSQDTQQVSERKVELGITEYGQTEITAGLKVAEWVVVRGIHRIFPNMKVIPTLTDTTHLNKSTMPQTGA